MDDAVAFAALIAPEIDRLFVAGHRRAAPYVRPLRAELGLPKSGLLIDLRALLLRPGGVGLDTAAVVNRYARREDVRGHLDEHVSQGFLHAVDGGYVPTPRGSDLLLALTDALEHGLDELWGEGSRMEEAVDLAGSAVREAAQAVDPAVYPAFFAKHSIPAPEARSLPFKLWTSIDALRYFRADAHALAWAEEGVGVSEIVALTALWSGAAGSNETAAHERLQKRGWVAPWGVGWTLTSAGRAARERIEARTNELAAAPFCRLSMAERAGLAAILRDLPA